MSARIATDGGTALHTAALHRHDQELIQQLVPLMLAKDLVPTTTRGAAALQVVATGKSVKTAETTMVKKYNNLLRLCDSDRFIPVCIAALYGDTDM